MGETLTIIFASITFLFSGYKYLTTRRAEAYSSFDDTYSKLLEFAFQFPKFRDKKLTSEFRKHFHGDDLIKYQTYAFMCWNFCETIYDIKSDLLNLSQKSIFNTWVVVIAAENDLHRSWFDEIENEKKFKREFRDYIQKKKFPPENIFVT